MTVKPDQPDEWTPAMEARFNQLRKEDWPVNHIYLKVMRQMVEAGEIRR